MKMHALAVVTLLALIPGWSQAQITFDGCRDIRGERVASVLDYSLRDVAAASLDAGGRPIIRYNPQVLAWFRPETRLFWYGHECGHHALGHAFGTAMPFEVEQQADCYGIRTLVDSGRLRASDLSIIQDDLARSGTGDWTHLPGPQRAINLPRCLGRFSQTVRPCRHPAHPAGDITACVHRLHPAGDVWPCQHPCAGPFGAVPCHPAGDLYPCTHVAHPMGDVSACVHPLHPEGDRD